MGKSISQPDQKARLRLRLRKLLDTQRVAVLASHREGQPYCSLIAFAHSPDLKSLVFATFRSTRKFANLMADPRAALIIDDRGSLTDGFASVMAVTAIGEVEELPKEETGRLLWRYRRKYPELESFLLAPDCAFLRLKVSRYVVVDRFSRVAEIAM